MPWVAGMTNPFVVKGKTIRSEREYTVKASQTYKKGELVRINASGQLQVAATTSATVTTGAVHGIAAHDAADYATGGTGDYAGLPAPVLLFTADTVIGVQLMAAKDQDDITIGATYTLAVASNKWTCTVTTGNGIALVVGKPANDQWFDPMASASNDTGVVYVRFTQALLDGRHAAT